MVSPRKSATDAPGPSVARQTISSVTNAHTQSGAVPPAGREGRVRLLIRSEPRRDGTLSLSLLSRHPSALGSCILCYLPGTSTGQAPEVVSGQGHGKGVDWWTLGILIYESVARCWNLWGNQSGVAHFVRLTPRPSLTLARSLALSSVCRCARSGCLLATRLSTTRIPSRPTARSCRARSPSPCTSANRRWTSYENCSTPRQVHAPAPARARAGSGVVASLDLDATCA